MSVMRNTENKGSTQGGLLVVRENILYADIVRGKLKKIMDAKSFKKH